MSDIGKKQPKEYSDRFDELRQNRVALSYYKYGTAADNFGMGFQDGYMACINEYKKKAKEHREQQIKARERFLYFLKQKLLGVVALVLTVVSTWLLNGDATVGMIMMPLGLALIFSNKPIIW